MWNLGVFVDADNVSAEKTEKAITMLQQHGDIKFIKAYGNWSSRNALWKKVLNQYGVEASHRYNITQRKNATDISLAADATASLYSLEFDTLAIVSSDSDYLLLVQHARSCGKRTIGVGFRQTPGAYSRQCDSFQYIDEPEIIGMVAAN